MLHIIFLLIGFFSLHASGSENNISSQPYTAQEHLQDIKMLLEPLKYNSNEIGFFEQKKRDLNQTVDVLNELFEEDCTKNSPYNFLSKSLLLITICIHKEALVIPGHKSFDFYKQIQKLMKKRSKELDRLKKEVLDRANLENNSEIKINN